MPPGPSDDWFTPHHTKLGWGELYDPEKPVPQPVEYGRQVFWDCLWGIAPKAITSLYEEVFPAFRENLKRQERCDEELKAWGEKWNLTDEWLAKRAIRTLMLWNLRPITEEDESFSYESFDPIKTYRTEDRELMWKMHAPDEPPASGSGIGNTITWHIPAWIPAETTWKEYKKSVLRQVREELQRYRKITETLLEELGLERTPGKRKRGGLPRFTHFRWLVRFQVREELQEEIAKDPLPGVDHRSLEPKTVQEGIRKTAELIGLTRRSL